MLTDGAFAGRAAAPDGVVLTLTDISALEQARAKLAQLSAIVESSDDAIVGNTLDGIITTWNNGACRLYGYLSGEAIGHHLSFLQPPDRKDEIEGVLSQVREGRVVERMETQCMRKDGSLIDVSVKFSPIFDASNAIRGVSAISRDITQLIRTRLEVGDREERIRLLLDSTAEAIYGIDLNGICTFCNPACARLLGYDSPAALIGKQMHPLIHHTKPDGTPVPDGAILDLRRDAPPAGSACRRRGAVAGGRHVISRRVLEPPDLSRPGGPRGSRDVPGRHRAASGRAGDSGRRPGGASSSSRCCPTSSATRSPPS